MVAHKFRYGKTNENTIIIVLIALTGGFYVGRENNLLQQISSDMNNLETSHIIIAVGRSAGAEILKENTHCESGIITVADFISISVVGRLMNAPYSYEHLSCNGAKNSECEWSYGMTRSVEGWDRILRFTYLKDKNKIAEKSYVCVDVPWREGMVGRWTLRCRAICAYSEKDDRRHDFLPYSITYFYPVAIPAFWYVLLSNGIPILLLFFTCLKILARLGARKIAHRCSRYTAIIR